MLVLLWAVVLVTLMQPRVAHCCTVATVLHPDAPFGAAVDGAPAPGTAAKAYRMARGWLDEDRLPDNDSTDAKLALDGTTGVAVILRLDGRAVGTGADWKGDDLMLRRAVGQAVAKALGDETIRRVRADAGDRVTVRLSLEIELAGPLLPLIGRTIAEASARVVPGRDGLVVRRGDAAFYAFPSRMLVTDSANRTAGAITALLVDAGLPAKDLNEYDTAERVGLARFASIRLRGDKPADMPEVIERGGRAIALAEITPGLTRVLAMRLVARLAGQVALDESATRAMLRGTLDPTRGEYDPAFASPRQTALAAVALAEAGASKAIPAAMAQKARECAALLVRTLSGLPEAQRVVPVDSLCAIAGSTCLEAGDPLLATLSARAATEFDRQRELGDAGPAAATAFAALAVAHTDPARGAARAADAVRELLRQSSTRPSVILQSALPLAWIGRLGTLDAESVGAIRIALGQLASQLEPLQVGADADASAGVPEDLLGGLMPPSGPRVRIEADCLAHLAGLATARLDGRQELTRRSVRFLTQLVADDPWVGGFRSPGDLRGLVRGSLGGCSCPPDALVFGVLLALSAAEGE